MNRRVANFSFRLLVVALFAAGFLGVPAADDVVSLSLEERAGRVTPDPEQATLAERHGPANVQPPGHKSVLVYMDPALGRQAPERAAMKGFANQLGAFVKYEYGAVMPHLLNLRNVPEQAIQELRSLPGVIRIEEDRFHENVLRLHDATPLVRGLQSQISGAGMNVSGLGIRVCVVDTGIDSDHIMYSARIDASAGFDFHNNDSNPEDDHGHGSHTSGIAVGGEGISVDVGCPGSVPFQGLAPEATLIGVKVLNQFGGGLDSNIIAGIDHCADQSPSGARADVINMSIGTGEFSGNCTHSWAVASNNAVANGVVAVASSGNDNYSNAMGSPACGVDVIAVGATYEDTYPNCESGTSTWDWGSCVDVTPSVDDIVCFSNESSNLDVVAPGCEIWSASHSPGGTSVTAKCGTSMSAPMVAGLAALILDADASLTPAQVRQLIRDGAIDMGPVGFDAAYGHGRIDVIDTLSLIPNCSTDGDCDDRLFCNGAEICVSGFCQNGSEPCPAHVCLENLDVCFACNNNGTCDVGERCETCAGDCPGASGAVCGNGICELGEDCLSCGQDCRGRVNGNPNNQYCCSGDAGGGGGPNPIDCTDSRCTSGGWQCSDTANSFCCGDGTCDDGENESNCAVDCVVPCSGPGDCDDGVACTDDACVSSSCVNTPNNANCPDDGQFCNGAESCDPTSNCVSSGDPCASNETCDETADTCDPAVCGLKNDPCSTDLDCCSGDCKPNGRCR